MDANLNQYKIFYTVAKDGNISHAAKSLYISQPAISKSISKLEENLDTKLFIRTAKGVELTFEGKTLFEYLDKAFYEINIGEEKLKNIKSLGVGRLRIGASASLCKYVLIPYLKDFIKDNPHIKLTISCQSSKKTYELLENGKIDIALTVKPENNHKTEFTEIDEVEDIFIAKKSYVKSLETIENKKLSTNEILEKGSLMLLDEQNVTRLFVDKYLTDHNIKTNSIVDVTNMDLLIDFAKIGMGIACVIKQFVSKELSAGEIVELKLNTPMNKRLIGFSYNKPQSLSDTAKMFLDHVNLNK